MKSVCNFLAGNFSWFVYSYFEGHIYLQELPPTKITWTSSINLISLPGICLTKEESILKFIESRLIWSEYFHMIKIIRPKNVQTMCNRETKIWSQISGPESGFLTPELWSEISGRWPWVWILIFRFWVFFSGSLVSASRSWVFDPGQISS